MRFVTVKAVSVAMAYDRKLKPGTTTPFAVVFEGRRFEFTASLRRHGLVMSGHPVLDLRIVSGDVSALPGMEACGFAPVRLAMRLNPSGVLKVFYLCDFGTATPDAARRGILDGAAVGLSEAHAPFFRTVVAGLHRAGLVRQSGPFPLDSVALGGIADTDQAFDANAKWFGWVSTHYIATPQEHARVDWPALPGIDGSLTLPPEKGGPARALFRQIEVDDGRYGWVLPETALDEGVLVDILDIATMPMEMRTLLDYADRNVSRLARHLEEYLRQQRSNDISTVFDYLVALRTRLSDLETLTSAVESLFRQIHRHGADYYRLEERKVVLARDFDTLQLAIQARRQRDSDWFFRLVTLVGLAFTAFSFVSTATALVDYYDHTREIFSREQRLMVIFGSLVVGAMGVTLALVFARSR